MSPILELGASRPWRDSLETLTGDRGLNADALREYFRPLEDWLADENEKNEVKVGWTVQDYGRFCEGLSSGASSSVHLGVAFFSIMLIIGQILIGTLNGGCL